MPSTVIIVENLSVPFDRRVWQESLALKEAGWDVSVICPRGINRDVEHYAEIEGVKIHRYTLRPATRGVFGYAREYGSALWHTWRLLRRVGPIDVLHACNPPDLFFPLVRRLKREGTAFVFDQHDLVPELYLSRFDRGQDRLYRLVLRAEGATYRTADVVIATNESYREKAETRGAMPSDRVFVVRSAPTVERFHEVPPVPDLKAGKRYLLCYLGVMGPQDGVDYALRALASLRDDIGRDDWHAAFMGSGDAFDDMVGLAGRLGLDGLVEFTGRIPDAELLRYLSTSDVCLSPDPLNPLNDVSTMNKVMEYMAMSRPIVSFELREARVSAGEAALFVPANDVKAFAKGIASLLDDPDQRARMGAIGKKRVAGPLSWDVSKRSLIAAYACAIGSPRDPASPGGSQATA